MAILVEQRTRATAIVAWGTWSNLTVDSVTDGTFTDTDLIQFRIDGTTDIHDLTNGTTVDDGTGVFDIMMRAVTVHIEKQFDDDRITGTDYANVYLGGLQSSMQQAVQFLMQVDLVDAQVKTENAKTANHEKQWKLSALDRIGNYDAMRANSIAIIGGDGAFKDLANHIILGTALDQDADDTIFPPIV